MFKTGKILFLAKCLRHIWNHSLPGQEGEAASGGRNGDILLSVN